MPVVVVIGGGGGSTGGDVREQRLRRVFDGYDRVLVRLARSLALHSSRSIVTGVEWRSWHVRVRIRSHHDLLRGHRSRRPQSADDGLSDEASVPRALARNVGMPGPAFRHHGRDKPSIGA